MQNRWETEIVQQEVPRTAILEQTRDRWETSNDAQISSLDTNRSTIAPQGREKSFQKEILILENFFLVVKPFTSVDSHTVPSSRFTRPTANIETISPPPSQTNETQVFSRAPFLQQRNSNSNSTIETLARQINMSTMNGNDASSINGQPTVIVKDTKVIPSAELIGAVTRAKDGS